MKILFIQNFYSSDAAGGAAILCRDLREMLASRGHESMVLSAGPENSPQSGVVAELRRVDYTEEPAQLQTIRARLQWLAVSRRNYAITRRWIDRFGPDAVYLHNLEWVTPSPLSAAVNSGKRTIFHAHNFYAGLAAKNGSRGSWLGRTLFKIGVPQKPIDIIAISTFIADAIAGMGERKNVVHTIHNGIPRSMFREIDMTTARRLTALFAGEITEHKGLHIAIEAVAEARRNGAPLTLDVYGPCRRPGYLEKCRAIAQQAGGGDAVRFHGVVGREEVCAKAAESLLFLMPSVWDEPFGLVAVEAMANGAIVIGSNRGAIPEIVGECGKIAEPSARAFAATIQEVIMLGRPALAQLRERARNRARSMFVLEDRLDDIENVLCGKNG